MDSYKFLSLLVRKMEETFPHLICFAYFEDSIKIWNVCINDFELYMSDERFRKFTRAYRQIATKNKLKILFCYQLPVEKTLMGLAESDNLIMNL